MYMQLVDSLNWRIQNEIDTVLEVTNSSRLQSCQKFMAESLIGLQFQSLVTHTFRQANL
jgi:hypothetical protein